MDPNALTTTSVTKFDVKSKKVFVKLIWKHDDSDFFHIKLFDGDVTWSGKFSNETSKKYRDRCEETEKQYNAHVKQYLQGPGNNDVTYDFVIDQADSNLANFIWKKRFEDSQGSVYLVHGSVPVYRDTSVESKDLLLDFLLEENRELKTTIESMTKKNEDVTVDLQNCKTELEKFVVIKNSLEASLYGKFAQLLNAKKRRIQILEGNLHNLSDSKFEGDS